MQDLGGYLREQRQHARLSLRQLAEAAGVSNPYLSQIERGLKKPSAEILQQLAKGLRISAESLYVRAGILDEREDQQVELEAAILADLGLSERQKRVLLDIYESFRTENARLAEVEEMTIPPTRRTTPPAARAEATAKRKAAKRAAAKKTAATKQAAKKTTAKKTTAKKTTKTAVTTQKSTAPDAR